MRQEGALSLVHGGNVSKFALQFGSQIELQKKLSVTPRRRRLAACVDTRTYFIQMSRITSTHSCGGASKYLKEIVQVLELGGFVQRNSDVSVVEISEIDFVLLRSFLQSFRIAFWCDFQSVEKVLVSERVTSLTNPGRQNGCGDMNSATVGIPSYSENDPSLKTLTQFASCQMIPHLFAMSFRPCGP